MHACACQPHTHTHIYVDGAEALHVWILQWLAKASGEEKVIVFRAWYEMWMARNGARDSNRIECPTTICDRVIRLMEEWKSIHEGNHNHPGPVQIEKWRRPEEGWVKANADGALAKQLRTGGGGAVLRDNNGKFIAGSCHFFPSTHDADVAELKACRRALVLAKEVQVQKVILETDSQVSVRKIMNTQKDLSANGQLVEEIKDLLHSFREFRVAWVRRSANKVAHILAREGCIKSLCKTWLHVSPECVSSEIALEGAVNTE